MSENKECLFYIDHNPPECSGTWGGAIHKGACKVNSTDCKNTDGCFIKNLYSKLQAKEQECEKLKREIAFGNNGKLSDKIRAIVFKYLNDENSKYKQALDEIEEFCTVYSTNHDAYETVYKYILDIINKVKDKQ